MSMLSFPYRELISLYWLPLSNFVLGAVVFSVLNLWPSLKCNDQKPWWRNRSFGSDIIFCAFNPIFKLLLRFLPVAVLVAPVLLFAPIEQVYSHLMGGWGPLGRLSTLWQCAAFLVVSDFLLYWSHRFFHSKWFWPMHAVHHGAVDVDWTTAHRFHPLNFALGPWLVTTVMIFSGVSPASILFVAPLEAAMAYFVHSNLKLSFGPLKYLIATPVFHRWHHTRDVGTVCNFGAIFSVWDVLFGTIYLPADCLPEHYGIDGDPVPESFLWQLFHPFRPLVRLIYAPNRKKAC